MSSNVGSIKLDPEEPMLDARDLDQLIDRFLNAKRKSAVMEKTVAGYADKLRWFRGWWAEVGPSHKWLLCEDDLIEFEKWLRIVKSPATGRKLGYHTRNDVLRRLREAFHWACTKNHTVFDYANWVPKAEGGPPLRRAAISSQLLRLMDAAATSSAYPLRDQAILACMIGMGLRRGEVVNLNVEDVTIQPDSSGYVRVHGKHTKALPTGERDVAMDSATGKFLVTHLESVVYESGPLFCTANRPDRGRITTQGVYRVTRAAVEAAKLTNVINGCHDLRRAFSTHFIRTKKSAAAADLLRRQMGHASFSMTSQYNLLGVEDIRREIISPLTINLE